MRRIDAIAIGLGIFLSGGLVYLGLKALGLQDVDAGIWTQAVLVLVLLIWLSTYVFRALTQTMTYNQQLQDYEDAVLQKRLEELSPEELEKIQLEIEAERQQGNFQEPGEEK